MAGELTPGEVRQWDAAAIEQVFQVVKNRDGTYKDFGDTLAPVQQRLSDWGGEAADAFHQEMGRHREHIDMQGRLSPGIVAAVTKAESDANACKTELAWLTQIAAHYKWEIPNSQWTVDIVRNPNDPDQLLHPLKKHLGELKTKSLNADHELAAAMRAAVGDVQLDSHGNEPTPTPGQPPPAPQPAAKLTPEEQAEVARWTQINGPYAKDVDNGAGDCSRWATASALANKYGVRNGPDGKEINLPPNVQQNLMGGAPLHFPPTKTDIDQITRRQGVTPGPDMDGFPGGPDVMSSQLNDIGVTSTAHSGVPSALMDQMTADLQAGHPVIVNGAFPTSTGHFISVTGMTTGPDGAPMYLVNDSNRASDGNPNSHTLPRVCTRSELEAFLEARKPYGTPGYSTLE